MPFKKRRVFHYGSSVLTWWQVELVLYAAEQLAVEIPEIAAARNKTVYRTSVQDVVSQLKLAVDDVDLEALHTLLTLADDLHVTVDKKTWLSLDGVSETLWHARTVYDKASEINARVLDASATNDIVRLRAALLDAAAFGMQNDATRSAQMRLSEWGPLEQVCSYGLHCYGHR